MKTRILPALFLVATVAAVGVTAPAKADSMTQPAQVQAGTYAVEPGHTQVMFSVSHLGFTTYYGRFSNVTGSLALMPKTPGSSTLEIHVPVNTVSTTSAKLDEELKSPQWLDAQAFPEMVFKASKIIETGHNTAKVTGDLTLHGVTKPVTLSVRYNNAGINPIDKKYTVGFEVSGKITRSDFGIKTYVPLIGDEVDLIISAAFERQG
jgi:polyisoprenoid-binding protein YceI